MGIKWLHFSSFLFTNEWNDYNICRPPFKSRLIYFYFIHPNVVLVGMCGHQEHAGCQQTSKGLGYSGTGGMDACETAWGDEK